MNVLPSIFGQHAPTVPRRVSELLNNRAKSSAKVGSRTALGSVAAECNRSAATSEWIERGRPWCGRIAAPRAVAGACLYLHRPKHREHGDQVPIRDFAIGDVDDFAAGEAPAVVVRVLVIQLTTAFCTVHRTPPPAAIAARPTLDVHSKRSEEKSERKAN
jgi:hypothetical protein